MSLSDAQRRVAFIVLSLPEAEGFALAGGAALVALNVVDRSTRDLDCFGPSSESVDQLTPLAVAALRDAGLDVGVEMSTPGFARLRVSTGDDETLLDLGFDPASLPPIPTELGAVRALPDLAGDKLLALFSRAAARAFVDVLGLLQRFTREELIALAARKDRGFSRARLAEAFRVLPTIRRDRFEVDDSSYDAMCSMFLDWRGELVGRP